MAAGFGVLRRSWKVQLDPQSRRVINHFNLRLVETGHSRDQTQAETAAGTVPALLEAIEALQHILAFFHWNPGTVICDRDDGPVGTVRYLDDYSISVAAVLDRIVDEVGQGV